MDNEFEVLHDALRDKRLTLNNNVANEHIPQIERQIKVVKERVHSTWSSLTYKKFPNRMISRMAENAVFCLNALPINSGMYCKIYPRSIMTGTTINFKKHCKIEFGAYAEAHKNLSMQLHAVPHITCYLPQTNRKPPRFLLVHQPTYRTPHQTTYLYHYPHPDTRYRPRERDC